MQNVNDEEHKNSFYFISINHMYISFETFEAVPENSQSVLH